jgi:hypothetical protein
MPVGLTVGYSGAVLGAIGARSISSSGGKAQNLSNVGHYPLNHVCILRIHREIPSL